MQLTEERSEIAFGLIAIATRNDNCFANGPSVTALNRELPLPREVRGPVELLAFNRLAFSFRGVTFFELA